MKKQLGISLLEIVLALVIIASIVTLSVRYFTVTSRQLKVTHAEKQIREVTKASYEWLQAQMQQNFSSNPDGTTINMEQLINAGLITSNDQDDHVYLLNPWGGRVLVTPGADPSYVRITMTNVPEKDCRSLRQQLITVTRRNSPEPSCSSDVNQYFGEF